MTVSFIDGKHGVSGETTDMPQVTDELDRIH